MKKKVILIFGSLITLLVVFSFVITSQGYTVGKDPFNGAGYDLKDKEFNYGTTYWSISGGNGNSYSSGRIGKCLKVTGSSDITISQKISSSNLAFVKNRYFSFGVFFKGTKSGDELRVSIKYRYEVRTRYGYRVITSYQYSDWEKKSQFSDKPWVLVTTNKKIPSTTFEITVRIHVRNTNGYSKVVYIDDAEMSVYIPSFVTESKSYYDYHSFTTKSSEVKYGIGVNIFSNEVLPGDHTRNQMVLSVEALAHGTSVLSIKAIDIKVEILPIVPDYSTWWNPWDYINQYDSLTTHGLSSLDSRIGLYESPSTDLADEFAFYTVSIGYQLLCRTAGSLLTESPIGGIVGGVFATLTGDYVVNLMLGRKEPSNVIEYGASGSNYENYNSWSFVSQAGAPYPLQGFVYEVPNSASAEHFMEWTYKNNVGQRYLRITATFHWCHLEGGGYESMIFSDDGTTTKVLELYV